MRNRLPVLLIFVLVCSCSMASAIVLDGNEQTTDMARQSPMPHATSAAVKTELTSPGFVPGELIVKFKSTVAAGVADGTRIATASEVAPASKSISMLNTRYGLKGMEAVFKSVPNSEKQEIIQNRIDTLNQRSAAKALEQGQGFDRVFKLKFDKNADVKRIAQAYALSSDVEFAQPNYIYKADLVPNDYYYNTDLQTPPIYTWQQQYPDLWGIKQLNCEKAWDHAQGDGVVVAVVDTGVDRSHPDLADNMWTNSREIPGNGIDDDHNGYVDDVFGWNFYSNSNNPNDDFGHGTHCAGTIAAEGNNSIGVIGVAPHAKIMALKFLGSDGSGSSDNGALAIRYAAENGAKVISNSWGTDGVSSDPVVESAIDYARSLGCIVVVAAGNSSHDVATASPACYPPVITVAALDNDDKRAYFSNYGSGVDVCAPGVDILSLRCSGKDMYGDGGSHIVGDIYYRASGTSMACPHVAGAAAVLMSCHPSWTNSQVEEYLSRTCDSVDSVNSDYVGLLGSGRVNLSCAVLADHPQPNLAISQFSVSEASGNSNGAIDPGESVVLHLTLKNIWLGASNVNAVLTSDDPNIAITSAAAAYGSIAEGGSATRDYSFAVSSDAPYGCTLHFSLEITADSGYSAIRRIAIPIQWPMRPGWPKNVVPYSITPVDVDGDGVKEVVVRSYEALGVYRVDGSSYSSAWPKSISCGFHDPSIGDIDGDGQAEIVLCSRYDNSYSGKVYAYKLDGTSVPGFPVQMPNAWDISQAVLADLDPATPGLELALTVESYNSSTETSSAALYALKGNGQTMPGFPYQFGVSADPGHGDANGCVAVGDIDNDGKPEIMAGAYYWNGGTARFYAFESSGRVKAGWPYTIPGNQKPINVVLGDLDNDCRKEIVLGTWGATYVLTNSGQLYKPAWSSVRVEGTSLALGDLDGDGKLEVVIGPESSLYYAFHADGTPVSGWPVSSRASSLDGSIVGAIGDINNDGKMDVVASCTSRIWVFEPDGNPLVGADPLAKTSISDYRINGFTCFPSIADMTGAGYMSVLGGICDINGYACMWDFPTSGYADKVPWPMQGHDPQRTGCYDGVVEFAGLKVGPICGVNITGPVNGPFAPASETYRLFNTSSADLNWSASSNQTWVNVSPTSGTIPAGRSVPVTVSLASEASGLPGGSYGASIEFTNLTDGAGNTGRPVSLTVSNGYLTVSPTTAFDSSKKPGGQISPTLTTYTLTNPGYASICWSAVKKASWISLSQNSGTLLPQASTVVTVSIINAANLYGAGTYEDSISFTNTTNGIGSTTRPVTLTIAPGYLSVTPSSGVLITGDVGGPFSPSGVSYTLQNIGYSSMSWSASNAQKWMSLSSTSGTLAPGAVTTVTASAGSAANALSDGVYADTITFTNATNGTGNTTRSASLVVGKTVFVDKHCVGSVHDGKSWTTAFTSIAAGISAAAVGQEVWVAGGDYGESFTLKSGVAVMGGYNASDGTRNITANTTTVASVTGADSSTLDGFTIAGIAAYGVYCNGTSPTITNNAILNNSVSGGSYGVYLTGSASAPKINANRFANSEYAILCEGSGAAVITNNIVNGNYVGIKVDDVGASVVNNLVTNCNFGISLYKSKSEINNNIVCHCLMGMSSDTSGPLPTQSCNDFFNNGVDYDGVTDRSTDIHTDPMFIDADTGDFHIPFDSPCIDKGTANYAPTADADGNPRCVDGNGDGVAAVDIGPYEMPWILRGLAVTPSTGFIAMGSSGGPFDVSSMTYTIKNISSSVIDWTVSNGQTWLSLSATGGQLAPGGTTTVVASLNTNAADLSDGKYSDTITFTDLATGQGTTTRLVTLLVGAVYVNKNASSSIHDGKSWDTGFLTVQAGINAAMMGQEVWVAQGTYSEKNITISKNIVLKGGFLGSGATRDINEYRTTIQSPSASSRVLSVRDSGTIDGFTISGNYDGILLDYAQATITNNTFTDNRIGIYCSISAWAKIAGNRFVGGIGITSYNSSPTITDNAFTNCVTALDLATGGSPIVLRNSIVGCRTGIACYSPTWITISNNLFVCCTNQAIQALTCSGSIMNNTIASSTVGIYGCSNSPSVANNIVASCSRGLVGFGSTSTKSLSHNDVYGCGTPYDPATTPHSTDLACDPLFVDESADNYHILPGSGCIDKGVSAGAPSDDIDGFTRPRDGDGDGTASVDIGCYETPSHYMLPSGAKSVPDGSLVGIAYSTATAAFANRFYVESADRSGGIGVLGVVSGTGKTVIVEGVMNTIDGEHMIQSSLVKEGAAASVPLPFYLTLNSLGGGQLGLQGAVQDYRLVRHLDSNGKPYWLRELFTYGGANNIGLLVKTTGRVKIVGNGIFYIDGATGFDDGSRIKGTAVAWPFGDDTMPPDGALVEIVGISSCTVRDGIVVRLLRPASANSFRVLQTAVTPSY